VDVEYLTLGRLEDKGRCEVAMILLTAIGASNGVLCRSSFTVFRHCPAAGAEGIVAKPFVVQAQKAERC
jgi:hypothetical protein